MPTSPSRGPSPVGTFALAFTVSSQLADLTGQFDELSSAYRYGPGTSQSRLADVLALGNAPRTPRGDAARDRRRSTSCAGSGVDLAGRTVLDAYDLTVRHGELVVMTGPPSRARQRSRPIASGVLEPDHGRVFLDGVELETLLPESLAPWRGVRGLGGAVLLRHDVA